MTKRELIDEIMEINRTAAPDFLAEFDDDELDRYLWHLHQARQPRPASSAGGGHLAGTGAFRDTKGPGDKADWPRMQEQPHLMGSGESSWLF